MAEPRPASNQHPPESVVHLDRILSAFDGPLNEEQAWAVCYQCAHSLQMSWPAREPGRGFTLDGSESVGLRKDGTVVVSVQDVDHRGEEDGEDTADTSVEIFHSEFEMVNALGRIVYHALDYGCHEEEERVLSEPLEDMIDRMTHAGEAGHHGNEEEEDRKSQSSLNTDEGIVDGHESDDLDENENKARPIASFAEVLKVCSGHLLEPEGASSHYQAVCRALLAEAQDLSSFLQVIASSKKSLQSLRHDGPGDENDAHLEDIQPKQWARIWMQVLQQLRQGVKLKEISEPAHYHRRIPIEYELTPYEILMDDIRLRKFTLKEVLVNGDLPPKVKKEAHDVILDFIRSRPPLKPVPKDINPPLNKPSLYERLLREIRSRPSLAPASKRVLPERKPKPKKKKKKPKLRSRMRHQSASEGSCASSVDSEDLDFFETSPELPRKVLRAEITLDWSDEEDNESERSQVTITPRNDDLLLTPQPRREQRPLRRLETLNAPSFDTLLSPDSSVTPTNEDDAKRLEEMARESDVEPEVAEAREEDEEEEADPVPSQESPRRHSIAICQTLLNPSSHPEPYIPPECLALTVDEVIHIRSVLVKAEIENLRVNPRIHSGVLREKICFSCKKKFALFKRKCRCKLCKRLICSICTKKMHLPRGHFLQIPIESLSPTSPVKSPTFRGHYSQLYKSHSEPPTPSVSPDGSPRLWRREKQAGRPREPLDSVCCECKDFLREAVRSSQQASRLNGRGHRGSDFRLEPPPRLPSLARRDSEQSGRSTPSAAGSGGNDQARHRDASLSRQSSMQSNSETYQPEDT